MSTPLPAGSSMVVTGQTSAATQQGYAEQIAYNMQNNIPFSMTTSPNDAGAQAIAQSIYNQAQVIAMTPQSAPTIGSQVSASTTGAALSSNPGLASNIVGTLNPDGTFTQNPNNPLQQAQVGGQVAVNNAVGNAVSAVTSPVTSWLQANVANYGLVIMGGLLVLGALLISQRKNIETIVTTGAKVAAI